MNIVACDGLKFVATAEGAFAGSGFVAQVRKSITPSNATNKNISWKSDNARVATVDQNGKVTAIYEEEYTHVGLVDEVKKLDDLDIPEQNGNQVKLNNLILTERYTVTIPAYEAGNVGARVSSINTNVYKTGYKAVDVIIDTNTGTAYLNANAMFATEEHATVTVSAYRTIAGAMDAAKTIGFTVVYLKNS